MTQYCTSSKRLHLVSSIPNYVSSALPTSLQQWMPPVFWSCNAKTSIIKPWNLINKIQLQCPWSPPVLHPSLISPLHKRVYQRVITKRATFVSAKTWDCMSELSSSTPAFFVAARWGVWSNLGGSVPYQTQHLLRHLTTDKGKALWETTHKYYYPEASWDAAYWSKCGNQSKPHSKGFSNGSRHVSPQYVQ